MNETWKVTMRKLRSTWHWFTENPQGGGFGSTHCGSLRVAFNTAIKNIPDGATIIFVKNGKEEVLTK
jgi:hypothetical protein